MSIRITKSEALKLFENASLESLQKAAHAKRCKIVPDKKATYIIMRILSYTNVCIADCSYCAFYRRPGDPEGYVLSEKEIFQKLDELQAVGGSLAAMEGGFNPTLKLEHYENLVRSIRKRYGDSIEIYGPTAVETLFLARSSKVPLEEALKRLRDAGLRWIPGGGAEILTNEWRRKLSPKKYSVDQYFQVMRTAKELGYGITSTMVIGFGEDFQARVEHLDRVREFQDETNAFKSFLCWTYQSQNTALGGKVTTHEDYLRTLAIARLYLDNIPHIRASFLTQGQGGVTALQYGADDFDVVLEDQVTEKAGVQLEKRVETVLNWVWEAGIEPIGRKPYEV